MLTNSPIEKAKRYVESHPKLHSSSIAREIDTSAGPCITISREAGARADVISDIIVELLNRETNINPVPWTVFDKNLIEKVIQDYHLPQSLTKIMAEKKYSAVKSLMVELLGGQPPIFNLVHKTTQTILQLAQIGNVVILDRAANIITSKLNNSFHVRLVAPLEYRIAHVQEIYNYDRSKAVEFIKREDADRKDFVSTYFHKDVSDPLLYHLVINTHQNNDRVVAEIIVNAVLKKFPDLFP
jgi:hypothetical protein